MRSHSGHCARAAASEAWVAPWSGRRHLRLNRLDMVRAQTTHPERNRFLAPRAIAGLSREVMMRSMKLLLACGVFFAIAPINQSLAQVQTNVPDAVPGAKPVAVEHIKIHGTALEGNLEGDAVDRDVIVFLPPSYQKDKKHRYPVVYALHGYSIGAEQWTHEIHVPQTIEGAFAKGSQEMIVVLPDSKTIYNGSMYSSSVTTGDFEKFIYHDVVAYIDAHYRTIPDRTSRGLVGHSMGGYGASRIGMKHPEVFGALYIMSPCCMSSMAGGAARHSPNRSRSGRSPVRRRLPRLSLRRTWRHSRPASPPRSMQPQQRGHPIQRTLRSTSICRPGTVFRSRRSSRNTRPIHRSPLSISTSAISSNTAPSPWMSGTRTGSALMPGNCIPSSTTMEFANSFEIYSGTHVSAVADRFQNHVLPFFSKNLCFTADCR